MNKILIIRAFEEAKKRKQEDGIKNPSKSNLSEELSNFIDEIENFQLGARSFRDYYNEAKKIENDNEDISIKQIAIINGLCKYIGYDNYQEFIENTKNKSRLERVEIWVKSKKIIISIIAIFIVGFLIYNPVTKQRWMIWQDDHYLEVKFDIEKYDLNQLKLYKEERIEKFKKVNVTCDTLFFNNDGSVRFWYGKNINKELEYFTDLGLHPETGKTLKPITEYMINKYICIVSSKTLQ